MLKHLFHPASRKTDTALIMLHGRGADEHDLLGLKSVLDPGMDIYSLRAPYEYDWGGYAWFDLHEDGSVDDEGFRHSRNEILSFIAAVKKERIFLLGFSMGAIMSYAVALTQPRLCRGIAALSGFAPLQLQQEYALDDLGELHIFVSHGINDPIIPIASARKTKELLQRSHVHLEYHEYLMAHEISEECLMDIKGWMAPLL